MPDTNANLMVQSGTQNGNGWINVNASNGQPYSFKYTGGANNNGGMDNTTGSGAATLTVGLNSNNDNRYSISGVSFSGPISSQLTGSYTSSQASILDQNTADGDGDYCVVVSDSQAGGATIPCDPIIKNDPPRISHS